MTDHGRTYNTNIYIVDLPTKLFVKCSKHIKLYSVPSAKQIFIGSILDVLKYCNKIRKKEL